MFDYDTLVGAKSVEGSIKWWGNHARIPADQILYEAQAWIYNRIRVRQMMNSTNIAFLTGEDHIPPPSDFTAPIDLRLNGQVEPLPFVEFNLRNRWRDLDGNLPQQAWPSRWCLNYGFILLDCTLTEDRDAVINYYATPPRLSSANPTNWLTEGFPTLLRLACTGLAFQDRKRHSEAIDYFKMAEVEVQNINAGEDLNRLGQIMR